MEPAMPIAQLAYLGFVLAAFGVFMLALGSIWIAERMAEHEAD
jgi:hypothetical protein